MVEPTKKHIELAGTVTLGPKGQVVIPVDVREQMKIMPGDKLVVLFMPEKGAVGFVAESDMQTIIDKMGSRVDALRSTLENN